MYTYILVQKEILKVTRHVHLYVGAVLSTLQAYVHILKLT